MRIAPPWLREPATRALLDALQREGIGARFVGGCVRDALLGRLSADIDLATPALPDDIIAALEKAGIRAVPTGIAHGTVTAVVNSPGPRDISRSRPCGAMSRPTAAAPASRSMPIGARTRRVAISRSTRSISTRTGPCTTRSAGWPISRRIVCGLSASRRGASPRMCCACCAITVSSAVRPRRRRRGGARSVPRGRAAAAKFVGRAGRAGVLRLLAVGDPIPASRMMRDDGCSPRSCRRRRGSIGLRG